MVMLWQSCLIQVNKEPFLLKPINFDSLDHLVYVVFGKAGDCPEDCIHVINLEFSCNVFDHLNYLKF